MVPSAPSSGSGSERARVFTGRSRGCSPALRVRRGAGSSMTPSPLPSTTTPISGTGRSRRSGRSSPWVVLRPLRLLRRPTFGLQALHTSLPSRLHALQTEALERRKGHEGAHRWALAVRSPILQLLGVPEESRPRIRHAVAEAEEMIPEHGIPA